MPTLPPALARIMIAFRPLFSKRVFASATVLVIGALLTPGRRTVGAALRAAGLAQERTFHKYYDVLSRAKWSALQGSRMLLAKLVEAFGAEETAVSEPLVFGIDDTIERRWGLKIKASGLRWLSMMLLTPIPWAKRVWALWEAS